MTITREQLEKAAKQAGIECVTFFGDDTLWINTANGIEVWNPAQFGGQLHDLAMACNIDICPSENRIYFGTEKFDRYTKVNCQDFPALAEAVILACCEQFDAKGGSDE